MTDDRERFAIFNSKITAVYRDGPDLIVTVRDIWEIRKRPRIRGDRRFDGTIRFSNLLRIRSEAQFCEPYEQRLEPGWAVSKLYFDGLTANLTVTYP